MTTRTITRRTTVVPSARVLQARGMFDVQPSAESTVTWDVDFEPDAKPWTVGLIAGPSGCGKSTIAREYFGDALTGGYTWDERRSVLDGFPQELEIGALTALLSSVGFASPPAWLRPFHVLSNGERFRVDLARALATAAPLVAVDEFTSVVDRQIAQIGSACVAKVMRRGGARVQRFVAVSCHYDIVDWLQPDWIYEPALNRMTRRSVQPRPRVDVDIARVEYDAWRLFAPHHYLTGHMHKNARCFVAFVWGRPAAFTSVMAMPHNTLVDAYRFARTVVLPDFQGLGLGVRLTELVGSAYRTLGGKIYAQTGHPALVRQRAASPRWRMTRAPSFVGKGSAADDAKGLGRTRANDRWTAGFEYVGPPLPESDALGLIGDTSLGQYYTGRKSRPIRGAASLLHRQERIVGRRKHG